VDDSLKEYWGRFPSVVKQLFNLAKGRIGCGTFCCVIEIRDKRALKQDSLADSIVEVPLNEKKPETCA
jgi:hypothetical protein